MFRWLWNLDGSQLKYYNLIRLVLQPYNVLTKPLGGELFRWMTGEIMGKASGKLA
jgi:hypothetical protein